MAEPPTDPLECMLWIIQGKAFPHLGPGITTHPGYEEDGKHEACLELERQGKVRRHYEHEFGAVCWMPVEESRASG